MATSCIQLCGNHILSRCLSRIVCASTSYYAFKVQVSTPLLPSLFFVPGRKMSKHWDPKFRKERARKFIKVDLPDYEAAFGRRKLSPEEVRSELKSKGLAIPRPWTEKPLCISSSGDLFDAYVPPEGDGKMSMVTASGAKQRMERLGKKGKSMLALRRIRTFEDNFDTPDFAEKAQEIYVDVHNALQERNEDKLHELVTEKCYPEVMDQVNRKTVRWKLIKSLEPPRVVHIRCESMISKENFYAQITVRFHTQQTLAIYDRFGRLMYGSEEMVKDVLEYAVFEKHLANQYGTWRLHGKIVPNWMPPKDAIPKTFRKPDLSPVKTENKQNPNVPVDKEPSSEEPKLATA